jgi:hypothetical protein
VHRLISGYIVAFPEDSTSHEIGFVVAGSSKASVFHPLPFLKGLRCCATDWKVAGSIPDGVSGIFH